MSIGILPAGFFESKKVKDRRINEEEYMYARIGTDHNFFGHLELAVDGGLKQEVEELYKHSRLIPMVFNLFLLVFNTYRVFCDDIHFLRSDEGYWYNQEYIDELQKRHLGVSRTIKPKDLVAVFELLGLAFLFTMLVANMITAFRSNSKFVRWICVGRIFHEVIPEMKIFSSLRLLSHVTPYVLMREVKALAADFEDRQCHGEPLSRLILEGIIFVILRLIIAVVGFCAFVVRFRKISPHIGMPTFGSVFVSILYLNQMLGVVSIEVWSMKRLAQFIFGGEDNKVSSGEDRVMLAWWAKLYERIWTLPSNGPIKAFAVSISFNDSDFQKLMLNEREIVVPHMRDPEKGKSDIRRSVTTPVPVFRAKNSAPMAPKVPASMLPMPVNSTHDSDKLL